MNNRKKHSIIAVFHPYQIGSGLPPMLRHFTDISTADMADIDAALDTVQKRAIHEHPDGYVLGAVMAISPSDPKGYASIMAQVNMGKPGIPA